MVEVDATLHCSVGSVSSEISLVVTPGEDRAANTDNKHVKEDGSDATRGSKRNSLPLNKEMRLEFVFLKKTSVALFIIVTPVT